MVRVDQGVGIVRKYGCKKIKQFIHVGDVEGIERRFQFHNIRDERYTC